MLAAAKTIGAGFLSGAAVGVSCPPSTSPGSARTANAQAAKHEPKLRGISAAAQRLQPLFLLKLAIFVSVVLRGLVLQRAAAVINWKNTSRYIYFILSPSGRIGGIFSTSLEDGAPTAGSATTNAAGVVTAVNFGTPAGSSSFLGPVPGGHQYWDAAARLTYAPILTDEALLHFGGSIRYQKPNDATAVSDDRVLQPGGTLKTDANIVGDTLLGTQPLTCWSSASAQLIGTNCVNSMLGYGAEFVASYGPFSVQGEYRGMHYDRNASIIAWQHAPGGTSVNFSGWYVYATWYLTGESRAAAYQTYPKEYVLPSGFGQIRILNPWSAGGWGAWEVAARIDEINFNSGGFLVADLASGFNNPPNIRNIQGGRETNLTFGLNWYPDKGVRFMANWVSVVQYAAPYNRQDLNGIHPNFFILRAQADW